MGIFASQFFWKGSYRGLETSLYSQFYLGRDKLRARSNFYRQFSQVLEEDLCVEFGSIVNLVLRDKDRNGAELLVTSVPNGSMICVEDGSNRQIIVKAKFPEDDFWSAVRGGTGGEVQEWVHHNNTFTWLSLLGGWEHRVPRIARYGCRGKKGNIQMVSAITKRRGTCEWQKHLQRLEEQRGGWLDRGLRSKDK
jgi:hypothetical protein